MKALPIVAALVAALAAPVLADAQGDVKNAMIAFAKLTSYHLTATTKGKSVDADVVNPGKMHVTMGPMEMIRIDTVTYVKLNGTWQKFSFPGVERVTAPMQGVQDLAKHRDDLVITDLGPKTIDGTALHAYSVKDTSASTGSTVYLDGSGNLARVESNDATVVLSKFNAPLTIEAPI